jgi:hypothetical protein
MPNDGPYVSLAVFCDRAIQERDGTVSIIRIIDTITTTISVETTGGQSLPPLHGAIPTNVHCIVGLKAGTARGRHTLKLVGVSPSGKSAGEFVETPILFPEKNEAGVQVIGNVLILATEPGTYWFSVLLDEVPLTRMPLRIAYQYQQLQPAASVPEAPPRQKKKRK